MVGIVGAGVGDIVQNIGSIEAISLRNCEQPLRPEGALGVDVHTFAFTSSLLDGELVTIYMNHAR